MRWLVTAKFKQSISAAGDSIRTIALVGGSKSDPELEDFAHRKNITITYFGVEDPVGEEFIYLDLNELNNFQRKFDLVISSQVLEHVWDLDTAFLNLRNLTKQNGLLWINCPTSNYAHGSPNYYSAGYTPEMISKNLEKIGFVILEQASFGSRRLYFLTHALQIWPSKSELSYPVFFGISKYWFKQLPLRFYSTLLSNEQSSDLKLATESIVLGRLK
jgi:SAM-dependent methyltransferase